MTKDEALRLADSLERMSLSTKWDKQAAAELRRLHELNQALLAELQNIANANPRTWHEDVRDQFQQWAQSRARAAIAKATGETT